MADESVNTSKDEGIKKKAVKHIREAWATIQKAKNSNMEAHIIREAESFLTEARVAMKMGEFTAALDCALKAKAIIDEAMKHEGVDEDWMIKYQELMTLMKEAESRIKEAKMHGVPTEAVEKDYQLAMKLMGEKDYDGAKDAFLKAIFSLESISKEFNRVKDIVLKAQLAVTDLKTSGFDVTKLDGMVNRALIALDYGRFNEAISIAEEILKMGISMTEVAKDSKKLIAKADKIVKEARSEGLNVHSFVEELDVARKAYDEKDYDEAYKLAKNVLDKAEGALKAYRELTDKIKEARNKIVTIRTLGIDTKNFDIAISEIMQMLTEQRYSEAKDRMDEVSIALDEINMLADEITKYKNSIDEALAEIKSMGYNVEIFESLIKEGKDALDNMNFKTAHEIFYKAYSQIYDYLTKCRKLVDIRNHVNEIITYMRDMGYNLMSYYDEINELENDFSNGNVSKIEKWEKLNTELSNIYSNYTDAREMLKRAEALIRNAKAINIDTTESDMRVHEIENLMDRFEFEKARSMAKTLIETLEENIRRYNNALKALEEAKSNLHKASKLGIDTSNYEREIMLAIALLENREFDEAEAKAKGVNTALNTVINAYSSVEDKCRILKARIRILERNGANTERIKDKFEKALHARDKGEYEVALELINNLIEEAKSILEKHRYVNIHKERVEREYKRLTSMGIAVAEAEDDLVLLDELIKEGDYTRAEETINKLKERLKVAKDAHSKCMAAIHAAWERVLDLYVTGIADLEEIFILRDDAAEMIKAGAYEEAERSLAILQKNVLEKLDIAGEFLNEFSPVREMLNELERIGCNIDQFKDEIEIIKSMINVGDAEGARLKLKTLKKEIEMHYKRNIELVDLVGTAQRKIKEAKSRGLDTSEAESIFQDLSLAWRDGRYDDAREMARKCIESILRQELTQS